MNYDLEKLNELRSIRKEVSSLTWMVFGSLFFIIPACIAIIWFVGSIIYADHQFDEMLKSDRAKPAAAQQ